MLLLYTDHLESFPTIHRLSTLLLIIVNASDIRHFLSLLARYIAAVPPRARKREQRMLIHRRKHVLPSNFGRMQRLDRLGAFLFQLRDHICDGVDLSFEDCWTI